MKFFTRISLVACLLLCVATASVQAQIKIGDLPIDIDKILRKTNLLTVKKGFNPKFSLGDFQINKVGLFGEKMKGVELLGTIFSKSKREVEQVNKLYKTYKTGLVVFKVLAVAGTAVITYGTIKGLTDQQKFGEGDVKKLLYPALGSIATGVITKILTKTASYKAVDIFNGIASKKIQDIFSIQPASSNIGVGLYVKL